jgi:hypothetical protein
VGVQPSAFLVDNTNIPLYSERLVVDTLRQKCHRVYLDLAGTLQPGTILSSKLLQYHFCFGDSIAAEGPKWKRAKYLNLPLGPEQIKLLARFRLSNHYLAVEVGRWRRPDPVPLVMRTCELCGVGSVQDEHHHIFVCSALHALRTDFPRLFLHGHTNHLNTLFALRGVAYEHRLVVAKDLCTFLQRAGGIYAPVQQAPALD